jgi:hypothetical protein
VICQNAVYPNVKIIHNGNRSAKNLNDSGELYATEPFERSYGNKKYTINAIIDHGKLGLAHICFNCILLIIQSLKVATGISEKPGCFFLSTKSGTIRKNFPFCAPPMSLICGNAAIIHVDDKIDE